LVRMMQLHIGRRVSRKEWHGELRELDQPPLAQRARRRGLRGNQLDAHADRFLPFYNSSLEQSTAMRRVDLPLLTDRRRLSSARLLRICPIVLVGAPCQGRRLARASDLPVASSRPAGTLEPSPAVGPSRSPGGQLHARCALAASSASFSRFAAGAPPERA